MIDQITVFLENKKGRVASVARTIADVGVNMTVLSLADSEEYGLARIVCGEPERALKALGIGVKLNEALGLFKYERVSIIILFIFAVVVLVDALSEAIRRRLK